MIAEEVVDVEELVPHSDEAEAAVIGALLADNAAWDRVGDLLLSEHFYAHENRSIYEVIGAAVTAGRRCDVITVHEALRAKGVAEACGGLEYLNGLAQSVINLANVRRHAEIVLRHWRARELLRISAELREEALDRDGDPDDKADRAQVALERLRQGRADEGPHIISDLLVARIDHANDVASGLVKPAASTGIPELDDLIGGGLRDGNLVIIGARPSVGKSSLALSIAGAYGTRGETVLVLSQEMQNDELVDRMISNRGRISHDRLRAARTLTDEDWGRFAEAVETMSHFPIYFDDTPALNIAKIRAKALRVKRRSGLRLIVVDYLQLCTSVSKVSPDRRQVIIAEVSGGLKQLAKELRCPVIALSQLNRKVEERPDQEPEMSDLREAGDIEQDADVVLLLWPYTEGDDHTVVAAKAAKVRGARRGKKMGLHFQGDTQRWSASSVNVYEKKKTRGELPKKSEKVGFDG